MPFCLLLPLGVLHGAFVRDILEEKHASHHPEKVLRLLKGWNRGAVQVPVLVVL